MLEKLLISEFSLSSTDCSYIACWLRAGASTGSTAATAAAVVVVVVVTAVGAAASVLLLLLGEPPVELLPLLLLLSVSLAADAVLASLDSYR